MNAVMIVAIVVSVVLSSAAQLLLKMGMTSARTQHALASGDPVSILWATITNIGIVGGLFAFGSSLLLWLFVLSRVSLSLAYPFVALGIVMTVLAGRLFLGEPLTPLRIGGVLLIAIGVILVASSSTSN